MSSVSLALFDDHPILLEGLVGVFNRSDDFKVVAVGTSATEAVDKTIKTAPDAILLDLDMPGNVLAAIESIRRHCPECKLIVFTASLVVENAVKVLEAGAHGYVVKGCSARELAGAINAVMGGETYIASEFASKVICALQNSILRKRALQRIQLSIREHQVIHLLLSGKTNREISEKLGISEKTVKHYMSVLMQKLNVRNRTEVVLAVQRLQVPGAETAGAAFLQ